MQHVYNRPAAGLYKNLAPMGLKPNSWVLYLWLLGLAAHKKTKIIETNIKNIRRSVDGYPACTMAWNTVCGAIRELEQARVIDTVSEGERTSFKLKITLL